MISIKIDLDFDEDFVKLFHKACQHEFTTVENGLMNLEQTRKWLEEVQATGNMQGMERIGLLKIYDDGELVGLSVPRLIKPSEYKVYILPEHKEYYRMGMIYVDEEHRGKGIAKEAARLFKLRYPNIFWMIDIANGASKAVASSIGLTRKGRIYASGAAWRHTPWEHTDILELWSN